MFRTILRRGAGFMTIVLGKQMKALELEDAEEQ